MWDNFELSEFACKCGKCGGENEIQDELIDTLQAIRTEWGKPMTVTSGYRCPKHPREKNKNTKSGSHVFGMAADIAVSGGEALDLLALVLRHYYEPDGSGVWVNDVEFKPIMGVGVNQRGDGRFLHLDIAPHIPGRPRPWVWTY